MEKRVLIARWLGLSAQSIAIYDEASVSSARQRVRDVGQQLDLSKELIETTALIASELTHNQLAHAKQGYFVVKPVERQNVKGLEVIAADLGPGIEKPAHAFEDGVSESRAGLGAGLGAVRRLADEVEFDNRISEGLSVTVRKFETRPVSMYGEIAIMGRPFPGEAISGDDAVFLQSDSGFIAAVSDGLGHGPEARDASNQSIEVLSHDRELGLEQILTNLNEHLGRTRGCVMSIVRFNKVNGICESVSVGDVHSHIYKLREAYLFTATPLVLGAGQLSRQRVHIERATVEPDSVLVMFTDGLKSRTTIKGQLDLLRQPAINIAQHLLENHSRPDDDALVLVARFPR
jgi:anti-sigma regulatory factor (Ser/Thr protein kinase)